jgi:hypothetical protein
VVPPGTSVQRAVHLQNSAQHAEAFTLTVVGASRPGAFSVANSEGTLAPGETLDVEVTYQGATTLEADVAALSLHNVELDFDPQVALAARTSAPVDAGVDAGQDASVDAGSDAGVDAGVDSGVDAGMDAAVDLPVFDGGGTCGNTNVLDLPLLAYPAPLNLERTEPSIVPVGNDFALAWLESLTDGGVAVFFERVTAAARPVVTPKVLAATRGMEARMAWNGQQFGLAWDDAPDAGLSSVARFSLLDGQGAPVGSPLSVAGLYRPGMTNQVPVWNAHTQDWAMSWGWWQPLNSLLTGTTSVRRLANGAFVGPAQDFLVETSYRSTSFAAAPDGGYLVAGGSFSTPLELRRLDDAFVTTWTTTLASNINGHDLKVVVGGSTFGVVWLTYDLSNGWSTWFASVDGHGALHGPTRLFSDKGQSAIDVAWNGSTYTVVVNPLGADGGWEVDELRFDELAVQQGPTRTLTCAGAVFQPRIAFGSGVHFMTYEENNGRRVLLFP